MENFEKQKLKKGRTTKKSIKGITLIALVITIIVLLILAGVTIATLTGDNGILTKAQEAKEKNELATEEEQRKMAMYEAAMNTENTEFQEITIPAGFAVTGIAGESTVNEGLVITDSKGNEYVWIEVPKTEEIYATTKLNVTDFNNEFYTNVENDLKNYTTVSLSDDWLEGSNLDEGEYNRLKKAMLKGIYVNGGFWIGRYESGYEGSVRSSNDGIEKELVVKEGAYPYNYLTLPQAQELANKINYGEYECSVMFNIQWDLVWKFIEQKKGKTSEEIKNYNCVSWGNYRDAEFDITKGKYLSDDGMNFNEVSGKYTKGYYETGSGILLTTGATKRNSALNIYDFAGNLSERTLGFVVDGLGHCSSYLRGGAYNQESYWGPLNTGGGTAVSTSYAFVGFRITLVPNNI